MTIRIFTARTCPTIPESVSATMHHVSCRLSILIPAYDAARHIGTCLASVLAQWRPGVEVVVVDDGSNDTTAAVLADVGRRYPEYLRLHHRSPNRGVAATRNELVSLAQGEYLWFIDADDTMLTGAIDGLLDVVDRHAPDLVLCDYERAGDRWRRHVSTFRGRGRTIVTNTSDILAGLFEAGQLHPWSKISRHSLWAGPLEFPVGRVFEDIAVIPGLASAATSAIHVPEPWVQYRKRAGSIVATMTPRKCLDLVRASADFPAHIDRRGLRLTRRALFAARHYAARHFVRSVRYLETTADPIEAPHMLAECLALFTRSIEGETEWLSREYLRRGWLWRWSRLQRALRTPVGPRHDTRRAAA